MRAPYFLVVLVIAIALQSALPAATPASKAEVVRYAEQMLVANYAKGGPGAAVTVARGDEVLFRGARGQGDVEHAIPLAADSQFRIASITKQFAAAGLLKLVEARNISLDDPLSRFVKDYPGGNAITVLELLNHTSGIKNYTDDGFIDAVAGKSLTTSKLIDRFKNEKSDFAPGGAWAYDNSGYALAGAVIEAASGQPWHEYLRRSLFEPLGLTHTGYGGDHAIAAKLTRGYSLADGKAQPARPISLIAADGALVSNVDDLLKWNRALHEGRVLNEDSYRRMITPVGAAVPEQYGLGVWNTTLRSHQMIGHSGHVTGFSAYLLYLPDSRTSVVVLQNMDRAKNLVDPSKSARQLAAIAIGEPYPTPAPIAESLITLREHAGVYGADPPGSREASAQGARVVCVIGDKLTIARTGGERSELIPVAADTYQSVDSFDRIHFERAANGKIEAARFFPWGEGEGLLLAHSSGFPSDARATPPRAALARLVGNYAAEGMELRIFLDRNRLRAVLAGQPAVNLFAESANNFLVAEVDATVKFAPASGQPQIAALRQGSEGVDFKRVP